jgi:hypothetical protein
MAEDSKSNPFDTETAGVGRRRWVNNGAKDGLYCEVVSTAGEVVKAATPDAADDMVTVLNGLEAEIEDAWNAARQKHPGDLGVFGELGESIPMWATFKQWRRSREALGGETCGATFEPANGGHVSPCHLPKGHDGQCEGWCLGSRCRWPQGVDSEEELYRNSGPWEDEE